MTSKDCSSLSGIITAKQKRPPSVCSGRTIGAIVVVTGGGTVVVEDVCVCTDVTVQVADVRVPEILVVVAVVVVNVSEEALEVEVDEIIALVLCELAAREATVITAPLVLVVLGCCKDEAEACSIADTSAEL
jgi:uncharacterized OB-fold protein